jgi:hypothetical protein
MVNLALSCCLAVSAFLLTFFGVRKGLRSKTEITQTETKLTLIMAAIISLLTFASAFQNFQSSNLLSEDIGLVKKQNKELVDLNMKSNSMLALMKIQISQDDSKLNGLDLKNIELNNVISGGNEKPEINIDISKNARGFVINLHIINHSKYPIRLPHVEFSNVAYLRGKDSAINESRSIADLAPQTRADAVYQLSADSNICFNYRLQWLKGSVDGFHIVKIFGAGRVDWHDFSVEDLHHLADKVNHTIADNDPINMKCLQAEINFEQYLVKSQFLNEQLEKDLPDLAQVNLDSLLHNANLIKALNR